MSDGEAKVEKKRGRPAASDKKEVDSKKRAHDPSPVKEKKTAEKRKAGRPKVAIKKKNPFKSDPVPGRGRGRPPKATTKASSAGRPKKSKNNDENGSESDNNAI